VSLGARDPGVPAGEHLGPVVLRIDLAPTLAAIAGVAPPELVEGRSLLPLLEASEQTWPGGRRPGGVAAPPHNLRFYSRRKPHKP
jgi:arylsulfatase A-like enzyme